MTDPLSIAGSVVGIAAAGVQLSISLFALVETVSTASERVESIANDISSTCGILNQLRDLITPQPQPGNIHTSIFNSKALSDISSALDHCQSIFSQIKKYLERATTQVKGIKPQPNSKIKLSRSEKAKWPFLQSPFNDLRNDLRDSKTNLLLMVAVANLAIVQKQSSGRRVDEREQTEMKATISRLQRAGTLRVSSSNDKSEEEKENGVKKFFQKVSFRDGGRKKGLEGNFDENKDRNHEKHVGNTVGAEQVTSNEAMREQRKPNQAPAAENDSAPQDRMVLQALIPSQKKHSPVSGSLPTESPLNKVLNANNEGSRKTHTGLSTLPNFENDLERIEEYVPQNHPIFQTLHARRVARYGPFTETETNLSLLDKSKQHQQGPPEESTLPKKPEESTPPKRSEEAAPPQKNQKKRPPPKKPEEAAPQKRPEEAASPKRPEEAASPKGEAINVNEPKESSPSTKANEIHEILQAWTFSILPGLSSGFGASLGIVELSLLETEIRDLLQKQEAQNHSSLKTLHDLNSYQRHLILAHIDSRDAKLLHVDVWHKESMPTVFGQLDIVTLVWITSSMERREGPVDIETLVRKKEAVPNEPKEPINFEDAVGRKFTFPYHLAKSWKGMEELIRQAFPYARKGYYTLFGPDDRVVIPQVWQSLVQPGWNVTMRMLPMPYISQHPHMDPRLDPRRYRPLSRPPSLSSGFLDPLRSPAFPPAPPPAHPPYPPAHPPSPPAPPPSPPAPPPSPPAPAPRPPPTPQGSLAPRPAPPETALLPVDTLNSRDSENRRTTKSDATPFFRWATGKSTPGATKLKTHKEKPSPKLEEESSGKNRDEVVERLLLKWTGDEAHTV